jgi:hypothetical protein
MKTPLDTNPPYEWDRKLQASSTRPSNQRYYYHLETPDRIELSYAG